MEESARVRQAKHRQKRRALGLCGWFGCEVVTGRAFYCEAHRERHKLRMQRWRAGDPRKVVLRAV